VLMLISKGVAFFLGQFGDLVEVLWISGYKGSAAEQVGEFSHVVLLGEDSSVLDGLLLGCILR